MNIRLNSAFDQLLLSTFDSVDEYTLSTNKFLCFSL